VSGIAGLIDVRENREAAADVLTRMLRCIAHRGPAGETSRQQAGVAMGACYSCLPGSTRDEQPFVSADGQVWVVMTGRILNRTELGRQLEERGVRLGGQSDAELIYNLYEWSGVDCLERLEGEFAFVIWDERQRRLFAVRDRLGIHHLFYALHDGVLVFASEIKAILASGVVERRLDLKALDQVLFMNCPVAPRTMFEGICALPAGRFLLVEAGQARTKAYWDLAFVPEEAGARSVASYCEELLSLLRQAVRVRLSDGRPAGVYLSGGLDSSGITMLMQQEDLRDFSSYMVDFCLPAYSERRYAELVAREAGIPLKVAEMSYRRIGENFASLIWHGEAPVVLMEATSLLPLARLAAEDVSMVLTGEGGDELFAGYVFNEWDRAYRRLRRFPLSLTLPLIRSVLPKVGFPKAFVLSDEEQAPALEHLGCFPAPLYYNYAVREVTAYYSDDLRQQLRGYCPEADVAQTLDAEQMAQWDPLSQSLYFSTKVNLANYLLGPHGDRAASAAGIEATFPYLDRCLVEFAARLPNDLKIRGGQEKFVLKRALEGVAPDEIVHRKKSPMTSPTSPAFLGVDAPEYVQHLLSRQAIEEKGYFDSKRVSEMVEGLRRRDLSRDRNNRMDVMLSFPLVAVLSVQIFDELFIENFYERAPTWDGEERPG
jgi:asparagine synthase (glutamine-hydrolysing)